ncbi:MAG: hypothetical protein ACI4RA_07325 [Kiritimatiellia bacterium]
MAVIRQGLIAGAFCWACCAQAALDDGRLTVDAGGYVAAEAVAVTNVAFTAAATISGAGYLDFGATSTEAPGEIFVPEGVTAVFEVPITNATDGAIRKTGPGALELTRDDDLQLFTLVEGGLRLVGGVHEVDRLTKEGSAPVTLHIDGAALYSNGYLNDIFESATIGAGGFTLLIHGNNHTYVSQSFASAPDVQDGGLTLTGGTIVFQGQKNTFTGGIQIKGSEKTGGQFRFKEVCSLGTGPISVISGTGLFLDGSDKPNHAVYDLPNALRIHRGQSVGVTSGSHLILHDLGLYPDSSASPAVLPILRTGTADTSGTITLALDAPGNEPIPGLELKYALSLAFDGGTLRMGENALSPFFKTRELKAAPVATVSRSGLTVDVAPAVTTDLGLSLTFAEGFSTNALAVEYPPNWSFEEAGTLKETGWTIERTPESWSGNGSLRESAEANGSAFCTDPNHYTSFGTHFAVLRQCNRLSRTVTVPEDGLWRVVFEGGCRNGGYGGTYKSTRTVTLADANAVTNLAHVFPPATALYTFARHETPPATLKAGDHTLAIELSRYEGGDGNATYYVDAVRLERVEIREHTPFVKTGAGTLSVTNLAGNCGVAVREGTLAFTDDAACSVRTANVEPGATLRLGAGTLSDAAVSVAAGATLAFTRTTTDANLPGTTLAFTKGARIEAAADVTLAAGSVVVDGTVIRAGSRTRLAALGVEVSGPGRIRIGNGDGTAIIIR